jgi:putative SOS response-associated peptidase YedK
MRITAGRTPRWSKPAGLPEHGRWDRWKDSDGRWVKTCLILTAVLNAVTSALHDRMRVILDSDSYNWLEGERDKAHYHVLPTIRN